MQFFGQRSGAQQSALSHIFKCAKDYLASGFVQTPRESDREILGSRIGYNGQASSVQEYDPSLLSLPSGRLRPVPLNKVLKPDLKNYIALDHILADSDVLEARRDDLEHRCKHITRYTDKVLQSSKSAYLSFLHRLQQAGILGFSRVAKGHISPFFVSKKNGKQRLVLD